MKNDAKARKQEKNNTKTINNKKDWLISISKAAEKRLVPSLNIIFRSYPPKFFSKKFKLSNLSNICVALTLVC